MNIIMNIENKNDCGPMQKYDKIIVYSKREKNVIYVYCTMHILWQFWDYQVSHIFPILNPSLFSYKALANSPDLCKEHCYSRIKLKLYSDSLSILL